MSESIQLVRFPDVREVVENDRFHITLASGTSGDLEVFLKERHSAFKSENNPEGLHLAPLIRISRYHLDLLLEALELLRTTDAD